MLSYTYIIALKLIKIYKKKSLPEKKVTKKMAKKFGCIFHAKN